jgi:3-deoxy-D-manno-octulosonic-acid transferase
MHLLYTLFSSALALLLLPVFPLFALRKKYRNRICKRLGWGLADQLTHLPSSAAPTFWIHALSVGEVTSALPLVRGLRATYPEARIIFSTTTSSGDEVANKLLSPHVDALIPGPIDLGPVISLFLGAIQPNLFILVETDFWPNWLHCLSRRGIPSLLVNGRISKQSFARYSRHTRFFRSMFRTFTLLSMQTASDAAKMLSIGIAPEKIATLGNLKFDTSQVTIFRDDDETVAIKKERYGFAASGPLWICGSTHRGEEELIFQVYRPVRTTVPDLQLLIAPRNIGRAEEIAALGKQNNLNCRYWSSDRGQSGSLLILNTIGELADCYTMADAVFVGGSLVAEGGHNPIEPAIAGTPVLFGPHMEDFAEIAEELIRCGGARRVESEDALAATLRHLLADVALRQSMMKAARACVQGNQGVVRRHLEAINTLLSGKPSAG